MADSINVTGNKKVETLMKEFNQRYPYLSLCMFPMSAKAIVAKGGSISQVDYTKTIASVRSKDKPGSITISGNKKIKTLEAEFEDVFGLFAQVCYTTKDGKGYYTGKVADEKTLCSFNEECEKNGCKKGVWK
ncbi:MAG: hypothetical protein MJZ62_01870 [Bacteroidales bacterium]|nr:hypothetical protein [Bacteroidales bacterium]